MNELAKKIKELRTQQKLTLEEVAFKVGVGKSTVRKWETGMIANMGQDKVTALAEALHTTPGYLMGWEESDATKNTSSLDNEFFQILSTLSDEDKEWLLDVIKSVIDRRK